MTSIKVPEPVMSLALTPKSAEQMGNFMKALTRFQKEDPTFRVRGRGGAGEQRTEAEGVDEEGEEGVEEGMTTFGTRFGKEDPIFRVLGG